MSQPPTSPAPPPSRPPSALSAAATGTSVSATATGASVSATATSTGVSATPTGVIASATPIGVSAPASATGASVSATATGTSFSAADPGSAVAVCLVTHGSAADLAGCMAAIGALRHRPLEIVVADSGSRDGSLDEARRTAPPGIPLTAFGDAANIGFAAGMNAAIAATAAPYILALNADARPRPDYLDRLLARMNCHPQLRVAAVTGRLVRPAAAPGEPPRLDACGMRLTSTWRHLDRGSGEPDRGQWAAADRVFGATGAASLFRRAALADAAIDGEIFDPRFHSFREDAELCFRLRERGWEVLYEPTAVAEHRRFNLPERRSAMPPAVNRHSLKNRYLLRIYHQTGRNLARTFVPTALRDVAALLYVALRERSSLGAYGWLLRHRAELLARRRLIQGRRTLPAAHLDAWFGSAGEPL